MWLDLNTIVESPFLCRLSDDSLILALLPELDNRVLRTSCILKQPSDKNTHQKKHLFRLCMIARHSPKSPPSLPILTTFRLPNPPVIRTFIFQNLYSLPPSASSSSRPNQKWIPISSTPSPTAGPSPKTQPQPSDPTASTTKTPTSSSTKPHPGSPSSRTRNRTTNHHAHAQIVPKEMRENRHSGHFRLKHD